MLQQLANGANGLIQKTTGDISKRVLRLEGLSEQDKANWAANGPYVKFLNAAGNLLTTQFGNEEVANAVLGELSGYLISGSSKDFSQNLAKQMSSDPVQQAFWTNTFQNIILHGSGTIAGGETGGNSSTIVP